MATEQIILDIRAQVEDAQKRIKNLEKGVKGVNKEVKQSDQLFQKAAGTMAALFSVAAIANFTRKIIEVRSEFEKYNAVLKNTLGSAEAANIEFEKIQKFASETPFSVRELTNAFVRLVNQGFKPTTEEMRKLGDLAASTGKDFGQLADATIKAMVGEFEMLKEFGILARKQGDQVKFRFKEVETQVKFTADAIKGYILSLGDLQGVSGAMAEISETLGGKISNLGDSWDSLLDTLGGRTSGVFNAVITGLGNFIDKAEISTKTIAELRAEISLMQQGAETEAAVDEFLRFIEIAKQEGESYLQVAERFLDIDRQRLERLTEATEGEKEFAKEAFGVENLEKQMTEEEKLQAEMLRARINGVIKFAREQDLTEQARLNKRIEEEFKAAQKIAKAWNKSFDEQMKDAENFAEAIIGGQEFIIDRNVESIEQSAKTSSQILKDQQDSLEAGMEKDAEKSKALGDFKMALAQQVFATGSNLAEEGTALQKTLKIAETTISAITATQKAYEWGVETGGPIVGAASAAAAAIVGALNIALVAGVTFGEGGFTGKSKLPQQARDRHGRIAGLVHEDEFVFTKEKTAALRPLFEDIHSGRIDARGLAALTKRGVILPLIKNEFNSAILEREVGKIYQRMREEKPVRMTIETPTGYKKIVGNTTINIRK